MNPLFKNRTFLIVQAADLLQQMGTWIRNMAMLFYIMEQTGNDPVAVSMLTALEYAPILIFSLMGGAFADRWNPKKTVIIGDALTACSILVILWLVSIGYWQTVFAATVVSAIVSQFSQPSSAVLFKRHVPKEHVGTAVGISQSCTAVFTIIGPILGTMVYTQLGLPISLMALFIIFIVSVFIQFFIPSSPREKASVKQTVLKDIQAGFYYVSSHYNLRIFAVMYLLVGLATGITQPLDVFITTDRLHLPKEGVQWFAASEGMGMLIGGILAAAISDWVRRHHKGVLTVTLSLFALGTFMEVVSVWPLLTAGLRVEAGIAFAFFQVVFSAVMINEVHQNYIGRTNGIMLPLMMVGVLVGTSCSGLFVKNFTLYGAFGLAAVLIGISAVVTLRIRLKGSNDAGQKSLSKEDGDAFN